MKKVLFLFFALLLCLSVCACESNKEESKYVGAYTHNYTSYYRTIGDEKFTVAYSLVLNSGGTGNLTLKAQESAKCSSNAIYYYEINKGDILLEYELEWKVADGYLVIDGIGRKYFSTLYPGSYHIGKFGGEGEQITISESYQLKGNQLVNVAGDYAEYTKVD